jgi:hypothetical protein
VSASVAPAVPRRRAWLGAYEHDIRTIAATTAVGLAAGFVVGGLGSRLAMRLLLLTTGPHVRGLVSDDGFRIGQFGLAETAGLVFLGTVVGVLGAFVYLAVRPSLLGPTWLRRLGCAIGGGAVVGAMLVHTDGVDFTVLQPRWFAIALFVALPAGFAVLVAIAVDRATAPGSWFHTARLWTASLPLLVLVVFPPLLAVLGPPVVLVVAVRHLGRRWRGLGQVLHHPVTAWVARTAWVAVGLLGVVDLTRDSVTLLG